MPTRQNDRAPSFGAYALGRLSRPCDLVGLVLVYGLFLIVGGWVPLAATHMVLRSLLDHLNTARSWAMPRELIPAMFTKTLDTVPRGLTIAICAAARGAEWMATPGLPAVLLFGAMLRIDHVRFVRSWHSQIASP